MIILLLFTPHIHFTAAEEEFSIELCVKSQQQKRCWKLWYEMLNASQTHSRLSSNLYIQCKKELLLWEINVAENDPLCENSSAASAAHIIILHTCNLCESCEKTSYIKKVKRESEKLFFRNFPLYFDAIYAPLVPRHSPGDFMTFNFFLSFSFLLLAPSIQLLILQNALKVPWETTKTIRRRCKKFHIAITSPRVFVTNDY